MTIAGGSRKPLRLVRLNKSHGDTNLHLDGTQALQMVEMGFLKLTIAAAIANDLQLCHFWTESGFLVR